MFSVFSQIKKTSKPSDGIRELQECAGSEFQRFLLAGPKDEPLYMMLPNIQPFLIWINKRILYQIPVAQKATIDVRLRIATSMLNNIEKNGYLPKEICILYHQRLVENVRKLQNLVYLEDLPF